ncbi:MAG TPA: PilZ domain-containing protein [Vicinamibacteria bacterium]|nr:PilZ domain-containing protein [Vicinamibacteria bacterium]
MLDRVPVAPLAPGPIRLHAAYRSAESLLRELSRALNQGQALLKADSGLPAGTHIVLILTAGALSAPIEVEGVVTSCRPRGNKMAMTLRYHFDPEPHRARLREALAELRRTTRNPRRELRVPLALRAEATALVRGLSATVSNASRAGARLELVGRRLPPVESGDRLELTLAGSRPGSRRPARLVLEAMWVGTQRRSSGTKRQEVGGRFLGLSPTLRQRILAILRFDDARPALRLVRLRKRQSDSPKQGK